ncbi:MAG: glutamate--tRNA ligase family protein, partial [Lentisphaeria bacterium]
MSVRVRFAPSPTGQVHIGNIRAAIFNWLYARHEKGTFLLRVEDTDRERSTPQAIATLMEVMAWLKLDVAEAPLYQTAQLEKHLAAAEKLLRDGNAYKDNKGGGGEATLFRIPYEAEKFSGVVCQGEAELAIHPEAPLTISGKGLNFSCVSAKGKQAPGGGCLAGFKDLRVLDENGQVIFTLEEHLQNILEQAQEFTLPDARKLLFTRRAITYEDKVKGLMSKPLDSMKDLVIVRSDGTPVFHLANVVDDITQGITHIIRGDDHVENTFRHLFLFGCLGAVPPIYAHLPMIVNAAGKPYSKRDGDAFV